MQAWLAPRKDKQVAHGVGCQWSRGQHRQGQFVRSRLVSMTAAELRRRTWATEDDYQGENPQQDPAECFPSKDVHIILCSGIIEAKGSRSLNLDFRNSFTKGVKRERTK